MIITCKYLLNDGSYSLRLMTHISSIHLSKRCVFYWFEGVEFGPFSLSLSSAEDINIMNDEELSKMNLVGFHRIKLKGFIYEKTLHN